MTNTSSFKILVLGSSGLLGCALTPYLISQGYMICTNSRFGGGQYQSDFSMSNAANEVLEKVKPIVIVNLIGLTDVDHCEEHPNQAYLTNVRTIENIVEWIRQSKSPCHLIHISTDQVYDGCGPHSELDVTLTNYYAFSKYSGELAAQSVPSTILRTNFFGRSRCPTRTSLTDWLFRSLSNNDPIQVFEDVSFSPMSMISIVKIIEMCILNKPIGVFNVGSLEGMSKADFSFAFANELNLINRDMKRITTDEVSFIKTYRPKDMRLNSMKIENALSLNLPELADEIKLVAREYREAI